MAIFFIQLPLCRFTLTAWYFTVAVPVLGVTSWTVLAFQGCHATAPHTAWPTRQKCSLAVLEAGCCRAGSWWVPLGKICWCLSLASGGLLTIFGGPGLIDTWPQFLASCLHSSSCMHVCVQICPFYKDASHTGLEATLFHYDFILTNSICNDLISK